MEAATMARRKWTPGRLRAQIRATKLSHWELDRLQEYVRDLGIVKYFTTQSPTVDQAGSYFNTDGEHATEVIRTALRRRRK
jgi:hypothetical protein